VRLIVRDYLSMLKESGELDALLGDLLLCMDIEPISKAQIGVRQHGVDLAAVGPDPDETGTEKVFLFIVKAGDINRSIWDAPKQGIRPSLNEVLDVYLPKRLDEKYACLPKKVVVCCNGDLKQEVDQNWIAFKEKEGKRHGVDFDFWGGDKLSGYIVTYFLDEYLFPETARTKIRKTLALVGLPEYDLSHFYSLIEETLFERQLPRGKSASASRKRLKAIRLVHLALRILFTWAQEENYVKPAVLAAEYTLLRVWDCMRVLNLLRNKKTVTEFLRIYNTYQDILRMYYNKIQTHCQVRDGLFGWGYRGDEIEYPLRTFEVIGILGTLGVSQFYEFAATGDENRLENMRSVAETLVSLLKNNPSANLPPFDGHSIEICIGLLLLHYAGRRREAAQWIDDLIGKICIAYRIGQHFPIASDSYDDLIALEIGQAESKEKLTDCSTIFPLLAQWCAILRLEEIYAGLRENVERFFPHSTLQVWYPDENSETVLYKTNASRTGVAIKIEPLPSEIDDVKDHIRRIQKSLLDPTEISCLGKRGFLIIGLIASRHYRTPVMPFYWQSLVDHESQGETGGK